ncbi:hypothetical protein AOL_s00075g81 [Orbilia oligospora ATCC 24927]|uniref:F-box domain-containing protein n=1 Tax=Arthrobotrys oligospora (strain ATCC 24927 / CBS 115.81 / DSM 1491) TaxID=756982 RepID=G1X882_ARTOA|nr:hypothetical protein AOL_s00075g81 [Orbilia oligospora ATCC 24927]EGX50655.1 hypothetical protein AOL_s00075g81 [Orbilia oligospora ATCC 24927]
MKNFIQKFQNLAPKSKSTTRPKNDSKSPASTSGTSLDTIPPELLSNILSHLPSKRDIFPLLLTSKRLYHITYPHIWKRLESNIHERSTSSLSHRYRKTGLRRLGDDITDQVYNLNKDDILGFKYLKHIVFWAADLDAGSVWIDSGLFGVVCGQIKAGRMRLRLLEVILERPEQVCHEAREFLSVLKEYSKTWPQKLKIRINIPWSDQFSEFIANNFRLEDITNLRLRSDVDIPSDGVGEDVVEKTIDNIKRLTNLLQRLPSLKILYISGSENRCERVPTLVQPLLSELSQLQDTILGLKRVQSLHIYGPLFHPSFFVTPPENVKKLTFTRCFSWEWWRQFSQCPFSEVEELELYVDTDWIISEWGSPDDIDMRIQGQNFVYRMEHLELKSLKKFKTDRWVRLDFIPEGFFDIVVANNPGLDEESRKNCEIMKE